MRKAWSRCSTPRPAAACPITSSRRSWALHAFVVPYANADEANHAPNENLKLDCFVNGIRTGAAILSRVGRLKL